MTDEAYDAAIDLLRDAEPDHPFLTKVGAPVITGDEVALPIPLPSLNKIKDQAAIDKWTAKHGFSSYHISAKLDGVSALWFPQTKKLYTRGDGMRGRDISAFVPYFQGLVISEKVVAVRGELIMRSDSAVIPAGKLARNIVAGALNRKVLDPTLFAEIRFITYELISVANQHSSASAAASAPTLTNPLSPEDANKLLRIEGFETARAAVLPSAKLNAANLSEMFSTAEGKSPYQMDGIVVAPNQPRPATYVPQIRKGEAVNPGDRVAWKTRSASAAAASKARTIVRAVEWNVSHTGYLIPRVLFDPVVLAGATIGAATGLHGRWIYDNKVGPGAEIEVRRAGDVIPQIVAVLTPSPTGPAMPLRYEWAAADVATAVHIKPVGSDAVDETAIIKLGHALSELGAENVGPGIVAKLYEAGFRTLKEIYAATPADFAARVDGVKEKGAERIWTGLRVKQAAWTTLNFLVASSTMPRGVGHSKLTPLLAIRPDPATWITDAAALKAAHPAGLSDKTIDAIVAAVPDYLAWLATTGFSEAATVPVPSIITTVLKPEHQLIVVFTGVRDKALEAQLTSMGHIVGDSVNKKTTHVVYPDGPIPASSKITKAQDLGIPIETLSVFKGHL
jgi:DNA ligase (NAD+)